MIRRILIGTAALAALAAFPTAAAAENFDVFADDVSGPPTWTPSEITAQPGDSVTWRVEPPNGVAYHDLEIDLPTGEDPYWPGGGPDPPSQFSYTFEEAGTYPFLCTIHPGTMDGNVTVEGSGEDTTPPTTTAALSPASPGPGGTYDGPVTVTLTAGDTGGSGVASTEYRVDDGAFQPYDAAFTVSGPGEHVVRYRSTDGAGNPEATKSVTFSIAAGGGDPDPPTPPPPPAAGPPPPPPAPSVALAKPNATSLADFLRKGLRVEARCNGVESGKLRLTAKGKLARRLGVGKRGKGATLASAPVRCGPGGIDAVLKPKGKAKRALKKADGSVRAKLALKMDGATGAASDAVNVKLKAPRGDR